jgi:O-antigen/teichoic acid export membrane protein
VLDVVFKYIPLVYLLLKPSVLLIEYIHIVVLVLTCCIVIACLFEGVRLKALVKSIKHFRVINQYFNYGKWLWLAGTLQWTSGYAFLYGGMFLIGTVIAGYVIALKNLFGFSSVVFQFYESYVTPRAVKETSYNGLIKKLWELSKESILIIVIVILLVNFFREEIILSIYGTEYVKYTYLIPFFSLLVGLEFMQKPLLIIIRRYDLTKVVFKAYLLNTIVSVLCVYPLMKLFGALGIVLGLLLLQVSLLLVYGRQVFRLNRMVPEQI